MKIVVMIILAIVAVAVCVGLGFVVLFLVVHSVEHRYWELRHKNTLTPSELCELEELEDLLKE
jgi:hypothetical protein